MSQERIRLARKKAGLTMQELAARITPPTTAQSISKHEHVAHWLRDALG